MCTVFGPHVCLHATCVPGAFNSQSWVSDPKGIELQTLVSSHVVLGIEPKPGFSARAIRALNR